MSENTKKLDLTNIQKQLHNPITALAEKLNAAFPSSLQSINIVGSCLTSDYIPGKSDINTVIVLDNLDTSVFDKFSEMAKFMVKNKLALPLLMTPQYIERSCDVFAIELLDFQLSHQTISGPDPFENLTFKKTDVRLQCERELKATLIRLRQGYIASAGRKKLLTDIMISTIKSLLPLTRAMLWLKDTPRNRSANETITNIASQFQIDAKCFEKTLQLKAGYTTLNNPETTSLFQDIYSNADKLSTIVDELEV